MASATQSKGPTSSQKKRRGKPRGSRQDSILITDIDTHSCYLGIVESIATGKAVIVKDLHTDKLIHCTTRKINTKFFNKGTPVVFSYISDRNGEVVANYSADNIAELTYHFKINDMKGAKYVGQITAINNLKSSTIDAEFTDIINALKLQQDNIECDIVSNIDNEKENEDEDESESELEIFTKLNHENLDNLALDETPTINFKNKNKKISYQTRKHSFFLS